MSQMVINPYNQSGNNRKNSTGGARMMFVKKEWNNPLKEFQNKT